LLRMAALMTPHERFLFDLNGFLVVRNVLTEAEVASANAAIDANAGGLVPRGKSLRNTQADSPMAAPGPRLDLGGMLYWEEPHCSIFREILTHPSLLRFYTELCGEGYRMDHQPLVIVQDADSEGFSLHGGPISGADGVPAGSFNPELQYRCVNGQPWTSLLAVSVQLSDHNPGDGGFCVVRGSHKLNLPVPSAVVHGRDPDFVAEHLHQPVTKKGDVVLFSEATVHGATPWRGDHQRRIALYRFSPPNMGYGRGYTEIPAESLRTMTPSQRAVLEPPYAVRLERPLVTAEVAASDSAAPTVRPRATAKKELDRALFGTEYF